MNIFKLTGLILICLGTASLAWGFLQRPPLRWLVCYRPDLLPSHTKKADWIIADSQIDRSAFTNPNQKIIAYLSLGEVHQSRPYWIDLEGTAAVVEENPDWPQAFRIDIRSKIWQDLLFTIILPDLKRRGFDGVFLDTVDTPTYLEERDPQKYKGSQKALINVIERINKDYPEFIIIPNNGLAILPEITHAVSAVGVEDLYTGYDFANKKVRPTPSSVQSQKEIVLDKFLKHKNKRVLNIIYQDEHSKKLVANAIKQSKYKQYDWYVTTVDLMKIGQMP